MSNSENSETINEETAPEILESDETFLNEEHTFNMDLQPKPTQAEMENLRELTREEIVDETRKKAETEKTSPAPSQEQLSRTTAAEPVDTEAALRKQPFPTIDKPSFKTKGRGNKATYSKDEVDSIVSELVDQYNSNMIKMEKTYLSGLEKTFALKRAAKDLKTKTDQIRFLIDKVNQLNIELEEKEREILQLNNIVTEHQAHVCETVPALETVEEPEIPEETIVEETEEIVEPVEPQQYEVPIFTDEQILEKTISVKLEEAQMEAHKIKLKATSQATEILGEAQHEASILMEKAEKEIERLTRSITEAAEAKLASAEKRQAQVTKLAKERKAVHRRLQKLYNQEITRLEKQLSDFDEIINSPSE